MKQSRFQVRNSNKNDKWIIPIIRDKFAKISKLIINLSNTDMSVEAYELD